MGLKYLIIVHEFNTRLGVGQRDLPEPGDTIFKRRYSRLPAGRSLCSRFLPGGSSAGQKDGKAAGSAE